MQSGIPNGPDRVIARYEEQYIRALAKNNQAESEILRAVMFSYLRGYRRYLVWEDNPQTGASELTPLQRTITWTSVYASTYIEDHSIDETVELISQAMTEEGRYLPRGVAEWIAEEAAKERDGGPRQSVHGVGHHHE